MTYSYIPHLNFHALDIITKSNLIKLQGTVRILSGLILAFVLFYIQYETVHNNVAF